MKLTEEMMLYFLSQFSKVATTTDLLKFAELGNKAYHLSAHNILKVSQYVTEAPTTLMAGNNPVDGWKLRRYIASSPEGLELTKMISRGRQLTAEAVRQARLYREVLGK